MCCLSPPRTNSPPPARPAPKLRRESKPPRMNSIGEDDVEASAPANHRLTSMPFVGSFARPSQSMRARHDHVPGAQDIRDKSMDMGKRPTEAEVRRFYELYGGQFGARTAQ